MDEARFIDWYPIVQAVSNGRLTGHMCPECEGGPLETTADGINVRVRCPDCSQGFEGKLAHGRDDALLAEADAMIARQAAKRATIKQPAALNAVCAPAPNSAQATTSLAIPEAEAEAPAPAAAAEQRPDPWRWSLPASPGGGDVEALSVWMEVVHAIHNGRTSGLRCPFCSEPLTNGITVQRPFIRVVCTVCGETFEGRVE